MFISTKHVATVIRTKTKLIVTTCIPIYVFNTIRVVGSRSIDLKTIHLRMRYSKVCRLREYRNIKYSLCSISSRSISEVRYYTNRSKSEVKRYGIGDPPGFSISDRWKKIYKLNCTSWYFVFILKCLLEFRCMKQQRKTCSLNKLNDIF